MLNRNLTEAEAATIVAISNLGENAYGVTIKRELSRILGRDISFGSTYELLDRLSDHGLLSSSLGEPTSQRGGKAKRFYRPTGTAESALFSYRNRMAGLMLREGARQ